MIKKMNVLLTLALIISLGFTATAMQGMEKKVKQNDKTLKAQGDQLLKDANGLQANDWDNMLSFYDAMESYLKDGGNIDHQDADGYTVLINLVSGYPRGGADPDLLKYLLQNGANVNHKTKEGYSVLMAAVARPQGRTAVPLLIYAGADVNATDNKGKTPLHFAAKTIDADLVKELIQAGADFELKDADNQTALSYAAWEAAISERDPEEKMDICEILVEAMLYSRRDIRTFLLCIKKNYGQQTYNQFKNIFKEHRSAIIKILENDPEQQKRAKQNVIDSCSPGKYSDSNLKTLQVVIDKLIEKYFPKPISVEKEQKDENESAVPLTGMARVMALMK